MILDSSALIAIVLGEAEATDLLTAIEGEPRRAISAATWLEAAIVAEGKAPAAPAGLDYVLARIGPEIVPVTADQVRLAREAFRRFGKGRHPARLNFGDCFSYALARERGEPLLFKGDDFAQTDVKRAI